MKRLFALIMVLVFCLTSCSSVKIKIWDSAEKDKEEILDKDDDMFAIENDNSLETQEPLPMQNEIPIGYEEIDFGDFTVLICDDSFSNCTPDSIVNFDNEKNCFIANNGIDTWVVADLISVDDIENEIEPFEFYDEYFSKSVNTEKYIWNDYRVKKYHIQTQSEGPVAIKINTIYYCIELDDKMVIFAYYPVMGFGGLHTEDIETVLSTIRSK